MDASLEWRCLQWPDGSKYEGLVKGNQLHGYGVMTFPNKDRYEGQFTEGAMDGYGAYVWNSNGMVFRGGWVQGSMYGCGVRLWKAPGGEMQAVEGKWLGDQYVGPVMPCSDPADATDAAVEADVAAFHARSFVFSKGPTGVPGQQSAVENSSSSSSRGGNSSSRRSRGGPVAAGGPDGSDQRLGALVQRLVAEQAARVNDGQHQQGTTARGQQQHG